MERRSKELYSLKSYSSGPVLFVVPQADSLPDEEFRFFFDRASPQRKNRANKFIRREDACRSLVAESLIRYALKCSAGLMTDELCIIDNEYGKPYIADSDFHFNISHSGELVICGIDKCEIGVDVEKKHAVDDGIADRFFSAAEIELLKSRRKEKDRCEMFFKIWSLKESYIKAIGKGLSCPLNNFACLPLMENKNIEFHCYDETLPQRCFYLIDLNPDYSCAVCVCHQEMSVATIIITPEKLINMLQNTTNEID